MKRGDVFVTPDGDRIEVRRVHGLDEWADIKVIQPHGASWTKRQPLVDGEFAFAADQRIELHDDDGTLMGYMTVNTRPPHAPPSVHHSETSQAAAVSIHAKTPSLRDQVYALLQREILTDEGIAIRLNLNPSTARPRRVELHNMGLIETHGTALTASGRTAQCWRAVPKNPSA